MPSKPKDLPPETLEVLTHLEAGTGELRPLLEAMSPALRERTEKAAMDWVHKRFHQTKKDALKLIADERDYAIVTIMASRTAP